MFEMDVKTKTAWNRIQKLYNFIATSPVKFLNETKSKLQVGYVYNLAEENIYFANFLLDFHDFPCKRLHCVLDLC